MTNILIIIILLHLIAGFGFMFWKLNGPVKEEEEEEEEEDELDKNNEINSH
jgi:flagellar basal body-associated protein FliL